MSFNLYLALATAVLLGVRWAIYEVQERTEDGPSFLTFMLDTNSTPHDRVRPLMFGLIAVAVVIGAFVVE